jgi:hypothetical protein
MKTLITKLIVLALIIFFAGPSLSYSKKDPPKTNNGNNSAGVTYVVEVDAEAAGNHCYTYIVSIKDEYGNNVDGSIIYMEGVTTYVFHEIGSITGTRSAHMERINTNHNCSNIYYTNPDHKKTNFRNGRTYMFSLTPTNVPSNN